MEVQVELGGIFGLLGGIVARHFCCRGRKFHI